jgi:hypothetical protein
MDRANCSDEIFLIGHTPTSAVLLKDHAIGIELFREYEYFLLAIHIQNYARDRRDDDIRRSDEFQGMRL